MNQTSRAASSFDCIIVGAGVAGCTAAHFLARAGLGVALLERGPYPGAKGITGGALFGHMVEPLFPGFWWEAAREGALEGTIVRQEYWFLTDEGAVTVGVSNRAFTRPPLNRIAVKRTPMLRWLAGKAVAAGARLLTEHKVEELVKEGQRVVGVRLRGELRAPVTIIAEGAGAMLATRAGLTQKATPEDISLYGKEVVALPPAVVRQRFNLRPGESVVMGLLGWNTAYLPGTASIYTYRDGIGLNAGAALSRLRQAGLSPQELLTRLKRHPLLAPLFRGGRTVEYGAQVIPEGGLRAMPELHHHGALIVGDAAGLTNGTHGMNLAMHSGKFAAEATIAAFKRGDFSRQTLRLYRDLMEESFVLKDLRANARVPAYYRSHPDIMERYPKLINEIAYQVGMVYPLPRRHKRNLLYGEVLHAQPALRTAADLIHTFRVSM